jgi:hypothetical protein
VELDANSTQLSRLLDKGISAERVAQQLGVSRAAIENQLELWLTRRWVVECDGRFLGVAASMDAEIPPGVPENMRGEIAVALYLHRMKQSWKASGLG